MDPNGAWYTSGIRLGTPALTTPRLRRTTSSTGWPSLIVDVLMNTEPGTTKAGGPSKASYTPGRGAVDGQGCVGGDARQVPAYPGLVLA